MSLKQPIIRLDSQDSASASSFDSSKNTFEAVWVDDDYPDAGDIPTDGSARWVASTGGSDTTVGGQGESKGLPWATVSYALNQINTGNGKQLILTGGNQQSVPTTIDLGSGASGTAVVPLVLRGETTSDGLTFSDDAEILIGGQDYWIFKQLDVDADRNFVRYIKDEGDSTSIIFREIVGVARRGSTGGANVGFINFDSGLVGSGDCFNVGVFNCDLTGPGGLPTINLNTSCIYITRAQSFRIENNILQNCPHAFFYKHFEQALNIANSQYFRKNWCKGADSVVVTATKGAFYEHNIFDDFVDFEDGSGGDNGADNNFIRHNTFLNGLTLRRQDNYAQGNQVQNNILELFTIFDAPATQDSTNISDYNLINQNVSYRGTSYTLTNWQGVLGQDENSIAGAPTYTTTPQTQVADYKLQVSSLGYQAGSDGTDMGVNTDYVGNK